MKGTGTITKKTNGKGMKYDPNLFTYEPTVCGRDGCEGHIKITGGEFPGATGGITFDCDECGEHWPHKLNTPPSKAYEFPKPKPRKKQPKDSDELIAAVRAEVKRRTEILIREREQFPPTLLRKKVRNKKGKLVTKWVPNPKFTDAMRDHMHAFGFSTIDIRDELIAKGMK